MLRTLTSVAWLRLLAAAGLACVLAACANFAPPEKLSEQKLGRLGEVREVRLVVDTTLLASYHTKGVLDDYYQYVGAELEKRLQAQGVRKVTTVVGQIGPIEMAGQGAQMGEASHLVVLRPLNATVRTNLSYGTRNVGPVEWRMLILARQPQGSLTTVRDAFFKNEPGLAPIPMEAIWKPAAANLSNFLNQQLRETDG